MTLDAPDFELLLQANRILSSKLDVGDVLEAVMELATKVVRAEASSLLLLDERTNELYFDVTLGTVKEEVKKVRLKVGEGIAGWVAKEMKPLIVNDVTSDPRFTGKVDKSTSFQTRSILAVPLRAKGKIIGVVEAINKEHSQDFTQADQEAFGIFASQSAIAIENARLFSAVTRERERLNAVFTEMSEGVFLLDAAGHVLILNEAGSRFIGMGPDEIIGRKFGPELFSDFEISPSVDDLSRFKDSIFSVDLVREKGKDCYLSAQIHRIPSGDKNEIDSYLAVLRDVTEEKRGEKLKQNFLSLVSHKLKTPLTVIVGYAPALLSKKEGLTNFQLKALHSIHHQGEHMVGLVDKLLRFTIVESEKLGNKSEPHSIDALIKEALKAQVEFLKENKAAVLMSPKTESLPKVAVDGQLMTEVFKNLVENAVKFNDKEKKEVSFSFKSGSKKLTIQIADNGQGIPPEEHERIFQKFYQVENSFTGQVPGAGLGLAFCKKVVTEMGGHIDVESSIGQGTTIAVTLPTK